MKKLIAKIFEWIFREQLDKLEIIIEKNTKVNKDLKIRCQAVDNIFNNIDVSIDHDLSKHPHSRSWAVVSIQGERSDFIKFVDLSNKDVREIQRFLSHFDRNNRKKK